jgi:phage virion morphogenesis protein|tara:strand:+ start:2319 stop:2804 length:486 start_codon:yes stop_codon:yes gene_type:complete
MAGAYDSDALAGLDTWLGRVMGGIAPTQRKRAAMKLGRALRRSNLERVKGNVEPDGSAMEDRKSRLDRRGRVRSKAGGKMFRKLRLARHWRIAARPDSVELSPKGNSHIPDIHHFGKKGYVGRAPDGGKVFTRYPQRRLLGFGEGDDQLAIDIAAELFDQD